MKPESNKELREEEAFEESLEQVDWRKALEGGVQVQPKALRGRKKIGEKISLILEEDLIERLKNVSKMRGIGYQTMIRVMINENISKYERKL